MKGDLLGSVADNILQSGDYGMIVRSGLKDGFRAAFENLLVKQS
jgi:hypothetical protein